MHIPPFKINEMYRINLEAWSWKFTKAPPKLCIHVRCFNISTHISTSTFHCSHPICVSTELYLCCPSQVINCDCRQHLFLAPHVLLFSFISLPSSTSLSIFHSPSPAHTGVHPARLSAVLLFGNTEWAHLLFTVTLRAQSLLTAARQTTEIQTKHTEQRAWRRESRRA